LKSSDDTCVVQNITTGSDKTLKEFITYRYNDLNEVSTSLNKYLINDPTTKRGYQFVIKDEYICRTTDSVSGKVNDDPVAVYLVLRTTNGNPALVTGADLLSAIMRLSGAFIDFNASHAIASSQPTLDRLSRGSVKPFALE